MIKERFYWIYKIDLVQLWLKVFLSTTRKHTRMLSIFSNIDQDVESAIKFHLERFSRGSRTPQIYQQMGQNPVD